MPQVNRTINGDPALDDVDHALGRPFKPFETYRDHYATSNPAQIAEMRKSPWWHEGVTTGKMTFFHVSAEGRKALAEELRKPEYGRLYSVSHRGYAGATLVMARSHAAAKYQAYLDADLDWSFAEYLKGISARLVTGTPESARGRAEASQVLIGQRK